MEDIIKNFNCGKIHTREIRGSVAFLLQILTHHILRIASTITLDIIN